MNIQKAIKAKYEQVESEYMPIERTTLEVKEVATYLNISKDLIYKLVRKRKIPHMKIGARIMFKRDSIDKWLNKLEQESYNAQ